MQKLPVHGFVLAGGKSSRMGRDKALLEFRGRPMVEIAVEKLRTFCATVSIAGNREDLTAFAPVVREARLDAGPGAGVEAGLMVAEQPWALFVPVDVPLVPPDLLRRWAEAVVREERDGSGQLLRFASYLLTPDGRQPAFCLLHRDCLPSISEELRRGQRRLDESFAAVDRQFGAGSLWVADAARFVSSGRASDLDMAFWFSNVNTEQELAVAEVWAETNSRMRCVEEV